MQYVYDNNSKNKCWYLSICNKSKCDSFCLRHYKMDYLVYLTTMEGKQKYPIELRPPSEDYKAFVKLRDIKNGIYSVGCSCRYGGTPSSACKMTV